MSHPDALGALLAHLEAALPPRTPLEVATDDLRTTRRALRYLQRSAERMVAAVAGGDQQTIHTAAVRLSEAVASTTPYLEERS